MNEAEALLQGAYRAFNARDIDSALAAMHPDVDWHNAMEDRRAHGHDEVRAYWTRQWELIDPHVEPLIQLLFAIERGKLKALMETDVPAIERELERLGAPYTPGRIPRH